MKGGTINGGSWGLPVRRRWKGLAFAVLGLVFLSLVVPLVFLLGLRDTFIPPGYLTGNKGVLANDDRNYTKPSEYEVVHGIVKGSAQKKEASVGVSAVPSIVPRPPISRNKARFIGMREVKVNEHGRTQKEEGRRSCESIHGSYCLWHQEHSHKMNDSMVKKLKDQLFVARAYYPSIAKIPSLDGLTHELKQNIQEFERILGESSADSDLPNEIRKKSRRMEAAVAKAKKVPVDCNNVDKKLRQLVDMTEDEASFYMKQSAFIFHLSSQTVPRSLQCLSMRLTLEYFGSMPDEANAMLMQKYLDPSLQHYIIFSSNVVAASVVINSTVSHVKESGDLVFHLLTDRKSYFAMKFWFLQNTFNDAVVEVLNVEDVKLRNHPLQLSLPLEFRVSFSSMDYSPEMMIRTDYLSTFSHLHYLIPDMFQHLEKVVILDDDIVVRRDLSPLWDLDMGGKVNGALPFCAVRLRMMKTYLGRNRFNASACIWMSGLNIVDLVRWRVHNLSNVYQRLRNENLGSNEKSAVTPLPATLLTFQDLVYDLDDSWVLSGLGHDYSLDSEAVRKAAVLHYNGDMKPWMDVGIPKYKPFWRQFLSREARFMAECNVNL